MSVGEGKKKGGEGESFIAGPKQKTQSEDVVQTAPLGDRYTQDDVDKQGKRGGIFKLFGPQFKAGDLKPTDADRAASAAKSAKTQQRRDRQQKSIERNRGRAR